MNIYEFIKKLNSITNDMTHEQLVSYIQEILLSLPDSTRKNNLEMLKKCKNNSDKKDILKENVIALSKELPSILKEIEQINSGKYFMKAVYYNCDDWPEYIPNNFIVGTINKIAKFIHECIDYKHFDNGKLLIDAILNMEVLIKYYSGDYDEEDDSDIIDFKEVISNCDTVFDVRDFQLDLIYYAYIVLTDYERLNTMFILFKELSYSKISFDEINKKYGKLPGYDSFIVDYIDYVCETERDDNDIKELINNSSCNKDLLFFAKRHVGRNPNLILEYFKDNIDNMPLEEFVSLGEEIVDLIPQSNKVHGEISMLLAGVLNKLGRTEEKEKYWIEALYSNPSFANYLRLRFFSENWGIYKKRINNFYYKCLKQNKSNSDSYLVTPISTNKIFAFDLFNDEVIGKMTIKEIQKKYGNNIDNYMSLLILFFYNKNTLNYTMLGLLNNVLFDFSLNNLIDEDNGIDKELLWQKIIQWRDTYDLSIEVIISYTQEMKIMLRNEFDMNITKGDKSYYSYAARLIAAMGEVEESNGKIGAKKDYINYFLERYKTRRNFVKELRNYEY